MNALQALWLAYLSQPAGDRILYRTIRKRRVRRILEIGVGDGLRAGRMIRLAQRYHGAASVRYAGVDLFEAQPATAGPAMLLKNAYRMLRATGAMIHLLPGDPLEAVARSANSLSGNELVIVATNEDAAALGRAWFYLPRMLTPNALVYIAQSTPEQTSWRLIPAAELELLASQGSRRRAA